MQYIQGEDAKERREAAQTAIRVLEQQLEGMKQVREAYQFARNARLYAIIYRQVEDMQIVLVSFGKATNLE